ncbi:MAG: hypothetical protein NZM04_08320, partial [Methylacidiphilales bacterium]|nr:hypothetical protein [Candidatus Methylacidiphilales bacterium]
AIHVNEVDFIEHLVAGKTSGSRADNIVRRVCPGVGIAALSPGIVAVTFYNVPFFIRDAVK